MGFDRWKERLKHPSPRLTPDDLTDLCQLKLLASIGQISFDADQINECIAEILSDHIILYDYKLAKGYYKIENFEFYVENLNSFRSGRWLGDGFIYNEIEGHELIFYGTKSDNQFYYHKVFEYDYYLHPNMKFIPDKVLNKFPKCIRKSEFNKYFPIKGPGFVIFPLHIDILIRYQ